MWFWDTPKVNKKYENLCDEEPISDQWDKDGLLRKK